MIIQSSKPKGAGKGKGCALFTLMLAIGIAFCLTAPPVQAQITPTTPVWALSNLFTIDGGTAAYTNISTGARAIDVPQGRGFAIAAHLGGSSTLITTGAIGIAWAPRVDGTNYATATNQWLWQLVYPAGKGPVFSYTNFPATLTWGADKLKIVQITNNTLATTNMSFYLTNVWVGLP